MPRIVLRPGAAFHGDRPDSGCGKTRMPGAGLEPACPKAPDFKSGASDQFRHPGRGSVPSLQSEARARPKTERCAAFSPSRRPGSLRPVTHTIISILAVLGVVGQALVVLLLLLALALRERLRDWLWGYELWAAFVVAAIATGGSLFF